MACIGAMGLMRSATSFNVLRQHCADLLLWYDRLCGHEPSCPRVRLPPPLIVKICGPDVTNFIIDRIYAAWLLGALGAIFTVNRGTALDLKSENGPPMASIPGVCPRNCPETVAICGVCVSDQVPGNVGLGAAAGQIGALAIGQTFQWLRAAGDSSADVDDSIEDRAAYGIGVALSKQFDLLAGNGIFSMDAPGVRALVRAIICAALGEQVDAGTIVPRSDCESCMQNWGG